jgi:hypothetical protein
VRADILQHPSAQVTFDPPATRDWCAEEHVRLDATEAIERLAESLGSYKRLATMVRNLGHIHGEQV